MNPSRDLCNRAHADGKRHRNPDRAADDRLDDPGVAPCDEKQKLAAVVVGYDSI